MIWLYSPTRTPRLQYVCDLLCNTLAQTACHIETDVQSFLAKEGVFKINYADTPQPGSYHIIPSGILFEEDINTTQQDVYKAQAAFFTDPVFSGVAAPFDLLGAIFFLASRYEEYLPFTPDAHGRFPATASVLYTHNLLQLPLINIWAKALRTATGNTTVFPFAILPTIDVDVAFRYKARSMGRHIGAAIKDLVSLRLPAVKERVKVLSNNLPDPNDTFNYQFDCFKRSGCDAKYFIQVGPYGQYDRNLSGKNPAFRQLIQDIERHYEVGVHPSYISNQSYKQLLAEVGVMAEIIGRKIITSRQHFLKLAMPHTYENLVTCGIEQDYSMGYSDTLGFRAGMASPFTWFNLNTNKIMPLLVIPFCVMDVTLQHFMALSVPDSIAAANRMKQAVKDTGGLFSFVFHNESLSDTRQWKGWRTVFESMLHA